MSSHACGLAQVGDIILYEAAHHKVSSFGLLWTHLCRSDGTRVAVSNEILMQTNIKNLSISEAVQKRLTLSVEATGVTQEIVHDLAAMVHEMMEQEGRRHLFDNEYTPHAAIKSTGGDPLRYEVRRHLDHELRPCMKLCFNVSTCVAAASPCAYGARARWRRKPARANLSVISCRPAL